MKDDGRLPEVDDDSHIDEEMEENMRRDIASTETWEDAEKAITIKMNSAASQPVENFNLR